MINKLILKILSVVICLTVVLMGCYVPVQAFGLELAGTFLASMVISVAASLGLTLVYESADSLVQNWDSFVYGLQQAGEDISDLAEQWTATYNNGILSMSDSLYNAIYNFMADYNGNAFQLYHSNYIPRVTINGSGSIVYDFDSLESAKSYINSHKSDFRDLAQGTSYASGSSFSFCLTAENGSHTNYLSRANKLIFSNNESYSIPYTGRMPYRDAYTDACGYYFFTIGKTCYLYLFSESSHYNQHLQCYINSAECPQLVSWVQGKNTAVVGTLPASVTGGVTADKSVYIPVQTNSLDGLSIADDVSAAQLTDLQTAVLNPAQVGTADGTLVQADSAVNDITATMDPAIGTQAEYGISGLQDVFPFCIPFDIFSIFSCLSATRETPVIRIHLDNSVIPFFDDDWSYDMVFDFAPLNGLASTLRTLEMLGFILGLAFVTRKLIGGGD